MMSHVVFLVLRRMLHGLAVIIWNFTEFLDLYYITWPKPLRPKHGRAATHGKGATLGACHVEYRERKSALFRCKDRKQALDLVA